MPLHTKLPKTFTQKLNKLTPLPSPFNIKNSAPLIQNLKETSFQASYAFASLDISNMYSNIPITQTKYILDDILKNTLIDPNTRQELLNWYDVITKQNYFYNNQVLIQKDRRAMGAPSSSILSGVFLQNFEHTHIPHLTEKHKLIN
jgi:hypothetical protein